MAGKPAARATDTAMTCNDPADMPVGTVIAVGTVLINGLPAAKQGDQVVGVDIHIIMIPSPGGPIPTPLPHPFSGMLDGNLISSVKIMGKPAAVIGSTASNMPPHIPQGGPFQKPPANKANIMMGSPNVLIGEGSGGSGSGGGGGGKQSEVQSAAAQPKEGHYLDVKFTDKGGKPITGVKYTLKDPDGNKSEGMVTGRVERKGVSQGSCELKLCAIKNVQWSVKEAAVGDKVKLKVDTVGIKSGEKATLIIFIKDAHFADHLFVTIESKVNSDKIEEEWELKIDDKLFGDQEDKLKSGKYSVPYYYFQVDVAGLRQRSGLLKYKDWIELELRDEDGNTIGGAEYKIRLPNGQIIKGKLDQNGYAKVAGLPPGKVEVTFDAG